MASTFSFFIDSQSVKERKGKKGEREVRGHCRTCPYCPASVAPVCLARTTTHSTGIRGKIEREREAGAMPQLRLGSVASLKLASLSEKKNRALIILLGNIQTVLSSQKRERIGGTHFFFCVCVREYIKLPVFLLEWSSVRICTISSLSPIQCTKELNSPLLPFIK